MEMASPVPAAQAWLPDGLTEICPFPAAVPLVAASTNSKTEQTQQNFLVYMSWLIQTKEVLLAWIWIIPKIQNVIKSKQF